MNAPLPEIAGYSDLSYLYEDGSRVTYRALDAFHRRVAVEVLSPPLPDPEAQDRFRRDADAIAELSVHKNIVSVLDHGLTTDGRAYLATELYEHGSVEQRIAASGPAPTAEVLRYGVRLAGALATAHRSGILHGDVRPANVVISGFGEPALTGFGLATRTEAITPVADAANRVAHASPESVNGAPPTVASDIYSLGSTLYSMLAGRNAFDGPLPSVRRQVLESPPPPIAAAVPGELVTLIWSMMSKDPAGRPQSAAEVGQRLQQIEHTVGLAGTTMPIANPAPTPWPAPGTADSTPRPARNGPLIAAGVAVVLLLVAVGVAVLSRNGGDGADATRVVSTGATGTTPPMVTSRPAVPTTATAPPPTAPPTAPPTTVSTPAAVTPLTPQQGGSITVAMFSEPRGLDPVLGSGSGTSGGTEMLALYDTIVRWNPETRSYDMRTAEALVSNAAATDWTLKLKPGLKFRDGTAYDAEAVRFNIERYMSNVNTTLSRSWLTSILGDAKSVRVVDPLTVRFSLRVAYAGFPALLAHNPGMILSPTKIKALGDPATADGRMKQDAFGQKPEGAGAGPFEIVSSNRGESLTLKASPGYHGGAPYLDSVTFVYLNSSDRSVAGLRAGTVDVAFLRTAASVAAARATTTLGGVDQHVQGGDLLLVNHGAKITCIGGRPEPLCAGRADGSFTTQPNTADAKVRLAVAAAIDPAVINARVHGGKAVPSYGLFDQHFTLDPGVRNPKPDLATARRLLDEAKAEGASGHIRLTCTNQPERVAIARSIETMLQAAGFTTTVRSDIDTATQITDIVTKKDFDLGCWGISITNDDTAILGLLTGFGSGSATNRGGYSSAAWDQAVSAGLAARDDDTKRAAFKTLAELWATDVPSIAFGTVVERVAWRSQVHDVALTQSTMFLLDKAWVG